MKKKTQIIGVFLAILITAVTFMVFSNGLIGKKTETFGSSSQPGIEKNNTQPYQISGTVKVAL